MPIYEYECEDCENSFEIQQKFSDKSLTICQLCGGDLRKVIHAPGIIFKGDGWYITDSRKQDRKINLETGDKDNDSENEEK
jgi:putative FmdB family regulatory protein